MHTRVLLALVLGLVMSATAVAQPRTFSQRDFEQLKFLEGRWQGKAPDGEAFYEEFRFESPTRMRATRYTDQRYAQVEDSSIMALEGGTVTSTWKEYRWRASALDEGQACFEPVDGQIAFCWKRIADGRVDVIQRFPDEQGRPLQYVLQLQRH